MEGSSADDWYGWGGEKLKVKIKERGDWWWFVRVDKQTNIDCVRCSLHVKVSAYVLRWPPPNTRWVRSRGGRERPGGYQEHPGVAYPCCGSHTVLPPRGRPVPPSRTEGAGPRPIICVAWVTPTLGYNFLLLPLYIYIWLYYTYTYQWFWESPFLFLHFFFYYLFLFFWLLSSLSLVSCFCCFFMFIFIYFLLFCMNACSSPVSVAPWHSLPSV